MLKNHGEPVKGGLVADISPYKSSFWSFYIFSFRILYHHTKLYVLTTHSNLLLLKVVSVICLGHPVYELHVIVVE